MPSSPGYVRDYKQERKTAIARGEAKGKGSGHTLRLRARRLALKKGLVKPHDDKDIDHRVPLSKGGSNDASNLRVQNERANRSFPRTSKGAIAVRSKGAA